MTESDIIEIELNLGIRLPTIYRQSMLSSTAPIPGVFSDPQRIIAVNELNRQMCWLNRPLENAFFIFGADKLGRELFLDLDFPEPVVMIADHERKCGVVLARTFGEWA